MRRGVMLLVVILLLACLAGLSSSRETFVEKMAEDMTQARLTEKKEKAAAAEQAERDKPWWQVDPAKWSPHWVWALVWLALYYDPGFKEQACRLIAAMFAICLFCRNFSAGEWYVQWFDKQATLLGGSFFLMFSLESIERYLKSKKKKEKRKTKRLVQARTEERMKLIEGYVIAVLGANPHTALLIEGPAAPTPAKKTTTPSARAKSPRGIANRQ